VIYVPERANPLKVAAMRRLGAEIVFHGVDFDESRLEAERRAEREGMTFVHSMNDWRLFAGVGTYTLEILEAQPDLDAILVPVGGGSGVCGALIAGKAINPELTVIGVQAAGAPAVAESWRRRELLSFDRAATFAEGLSTRVAHSLPAHVMWDRLDDFCLVDDGELKRAMLTILETSRVVAEGAGAASVAAAWQMRERLAGKKIACVVSGGNVTLDELRQVMDEERPW
jgi:threonine dehydratase